MHVLILENEPMIAEQIACFVESAGHLVIACVTSVAEALSMASRSSLDLLISDIDLGSNEDGIVAAATLRRTRNIKTIFVTAHADAASRDRAQHAWPIAYLTKPFGAREFAGLMVMAETLIRPHPAFVAPEPSPTIARYHSVAATLAVA